MANPRTIARLEARILERAAHAIEFELSDPRSGFITLTRVKLAKDLSAAKVYYSVLGDAAEKSKAAHMLASAAGFIQRQVGRVLDLRRVPRLTFVYDESIEEAARMDELIRNALERDRVIAEQGAPPPEDEDGDWEGEYDEFKDRDKPPTPPPIQGP